jgi:hypothetical protein
MITNPKIGDPHMSIEVTLERIAVALEALATNATKAPAPSQPKEDAKQTQARVEKAAKLAKPAKDEPKEETADAPSEEAVGKAIASMLSANLKDAAIELLGKFGAKSKSTLKSSDYAAFVAGANEILLGA